MRKGTNGQGEGHRVVEFLTAPALPIPMLFCRQPRFSSSTSMASMTADSQVFKLRGDDVHGTIIVLELRILQPCLPSHHPPHLIAHNRAPSHTR